MFKKCVTEGFSTSTVCSLAISLSNGSKNFALLRENSPVESHGISFFDINCVSNF